MQFQSACVWGIDAEAPKCYNLVATSRNNKKVKMHHQLDYAALMRQRGFRVTWQRRLILDAICESGKHTTPDDIYRRVRAQAPALNRATVYRNLVFLCELRLVVAIQIGGHTYYEIAGENPHHHLVCRRCGGLTQLDNSLLETFVQTVDKQHRFTVDMDHVGLFGLCDQCRRAEHRRRL
jgi:Fur family ferric uptake transcriptional regulator